MFPFNIWERKSLWLLLLDLEPPPEIEVKLIFNRSAAVNHNCDSVTSQKCYPEAQSKLHVTRKIIPKPLTNEKLISPLNEFLIVYSFTWQGKEINDDVHFGMQLNTSKFKDMVEIKSNSAWNDVQSLIKEVAIHRRIGEHNLMFYQWKLK